MDSGVIVKEFRNRFGAVIANGQGSMKGQIFRIAHLGYFDFAGNADLAIAIRTAFLRDGVARVQAGAGLVLDSVPETEYEETVNKAGAPARAVTAANGLKPVV